MTEGKNTDRERRRAVCRPAPLHGIRFSEVSGDHLGTPPRSRPRMYPYVRPEPVEFPGTSMG